MNNRYIGALMLSPLIILLFLGGIYLKYGVMILSLLGMYEFYKVTKEKDIHSIAVIGYFLCIIYYITLDRDINFNFIFLLLIISIFILMCIPIFGIEYNFIDISITILGFLYISVFFSFIVLVNNKVYGNYLIWIIFISSWLCDTAAYYSGRTFGKTKLCPKVSPKKTVEGSIGGILGSAIGCGIFGYIIQHNGISISIYHFVMLGVICGIFSQFGDLSASSIKRYAGVKDYGKLIPGHGGILDRFDSILFASVTVYYYITFVVGI